MDSICFKRKAKSKKKHKSEKVAEKKQPKPIKGELKLYNIQGRTTDPDFAIYRYFTDPAYKRICAKYELIDVPNCVEQSGKTERSNEMQRESVRKDEQDFQEQENGEYSSCDRPHPRLGGKIELETSGKQENEMISEDRRYAADAVAFFVQHSQRGIVSLCASLANLLKERDLLKQELKKMEQQWKKDETCDHSEFSRYVSVGVSTCECVKTALSDCECTYVPCEEKKAEIEQKSQCKLNKRKTIKGCLCNFCGTEKSHLESIAAPIENGDKVIIKGGILGIVKYVGHIDGDLENSIHVGLQLDVPIGNSNGTVEGKTYFKCTEHYGHFILLKDILCVV